MEVENFTTYNNAQHQPTASKRASRQSIIPMARPSTGSIGTSSDPTDDESEIYDQLLQILTTPSLSVMKVLAHNTNGAYTDALVQTSSTVFGTLGTLLPVVAHAIRWEMSNGHKLHQVFDSRSFTTKLISSTTFFFGKQHLKDVLEPWLNTMLECPDMSYEINPAAIAESDNMGINRSSLRNLVTRLLTAIQSKFHLIPDPLRAIWYLIGFETNKKSRGTANDALSNFIYSKFWGPAIACPQKYGIYDGDLPPKVKRGLVLTSKLVQSISGRRAFREVYMKCMDSFRDGLSEKLSAYTMLVSECPDAIDRSMVHKLGHNEISVSPWIAHIRAEYPYESKGSELAQESIHRTYQVLYDNATKIDNSCQDNDVTKDLLSQVVRKLGPPNSVTFTPWKFGACLNKKMIADEGTFGGWNKVSATYPGTDYNLGKVANPSWAVIDPQYSPINHTDHRVVNADPDTSAIPTVIKFNQIDKVFNVDRRSGEGNYKIVNGLPRNPRVRTGFAGRGCLQRWGPNHLGHPVITRWCRNSDGKIHERFCRPVLEVLVTRLDNGYIGVPVCQLDVGATIPRTIADLLGVTPDPYKPVEQSEGLDSAQFLQFTGAAKAEQVDTYDSSEPTLTRVPTLPKNHRRKHPGDKLLEKLERHTLLHSGYLDDPRNTDNAWVESTALHIHDEQGILEQAVGAAINNSEELPLFWIPVDEDTVWDRHTREIITRAAINLDAHFNDRILPVLFELLTNIEKRGLDYEGLYRLSGSKKNISRIVLSCYDGTLSNQILQIEDIHELTGVVKELLRKMEPPLIPYTLYDDLLELAECSSYDVQNAAKSDLLLALPHTNLKILALLIDHLHKVDERSAFNKMPIANLAVVFAPTSIRSPNGLTADMNDQGAQCRSMCAILQTTAAEVDALSAVRDPFKAEIFHFTILQDSLKSLRVCNGGVMTISSEPLDSRESDVDEIPLIDHNKKVTERVIERPVLSPDAEDEYAFPEDALPKSDSNRLSQISEASSRYDRIGGSMSPMCGESPAGSMRNSTIDEGIYDNVDNAPQPEAGIKSQKRLVLKESSSIETDTDIINPGDIPVDDPDKSNCIANISDAEDSDDTDDAGSEDDAGWTVIRSQMNKRTITNDSVISATETEISAIEDPDISTTVQQTDPKEEQSKPVQQPQDESGSKVNPASKTMEQKCTVSANLKSKPSTLSNPQIPELLNLVGLSLLDVTDVVEAFDPALDISSGDNHKERRLTLAEANEQAAAAISREDKLPFGPVASSSTDPDVKSTIEPQPETQSQTNESELNSISGESEMLGTCEECLTKNSTGWIDPETRQFFCTSCWSVYEEDWETVEDSSVSASTNTGTESGIEAGTESKSPVITLQYDEDGLPMDSIVDDHRAIRLGSRLTSTQSDNYMDLQYDEDGLPYDEKHGDEWEDSIKSPMRNRKGTVRISLKAVKTKDLVTIASLPNKLSRKLTEQLSSQVKQLQTRIEGSLSREVGATWKKRYFVLHDTMLKIYKNKSAKSGKPSEYFNITRKSEVARFGDKLFQLSIPEKGYVITMKSSSKSAVNDWVRILSNACRIAASLPQHY